MTCSVEVNDLPCRQGQMSASKRLLPTRRQSLTSPTTIRGVQCLLTRSPSAGNAAASRRRPATTSTTVSTTRAELDPHNLPDFMINFNPAFPRLSPTLNNNINNDDDPDPNKAKLGKSTFPVPLPIVEPNLTPNPSPQSPPIPATDPPPLPFTTRDPLT